MPYAKIGLYCLYQMNAELVAVAYDGEILSTSLQVQPIFPKVEPVESARGIQVTQIEEEETLLPKQCIEIPSPRSRKGNRNKNKEGYEKSGKV